MGFSLLEISHFGGVYTPSAAVKQGFLQKKISLFPTAAGRGRQRLFLLFYLRSAMEIFIY